LGGEHDDDDPFWMMSPVTLPDLAWFYQSQVGGGDHHGGLNAGAKIMLRLALYDLFQKITTSLPHPYDTRTHPHG
jgi:hypothetical protein